MKRTNIKLWAGVILALLTVSSCDDKLDINQNPNQAVSADVQLVLPQAIVASANISNQYNSYGGHFGGFIANAGGFSGFGNLLSYNLTPTDWNGLWVNTYQDPLKDLKFVIDKTEGVDQYAYFNAAAKIMTVVNYQRLVDTFGDVPFSQALRGEEGITAPEYDDAATIYNELLAMLDDAIETIDNATAPLSLTNASDPLFGAAPGSTSQRDAEEEITDWKRYANTLKLRILVRLSSTTDMSAEFATLDLGLGFLTDDAIVDPGYEKNRPNPEWATWGRTTTDALANSSRIPTAYAFAFYGGASSKISDAGRGRTIFVNFPATPVNQLGNEVGNPTIIAGQVTWAGNTAGYTGRGVLKGPGMGQPLMTKAEAHFLYAEAQANGDLPGGAAGAELEFNRGIKSSFAYLYKDENEAMMDTTGLVAAYFTANSTNDLVIFPTAGTLAEQIEAIITQKYIALNMINSDEAYNEYRRTGFPVSVAGNARTDIASNKSTITGRADRLPTRVMYPSSEQSYNSANYVTVDYESDLIFWDPN